MDECVDEFMNNLGLLYSSHLRSRKGIIYSHKLSLIQINNFGLRIFYTYF
jgi:hypothetical protein